MTWHLELDSESYARACRNFAWDLPDDYNISRDCLRKHENADDRPALFQGHPDGERTTYTFGELDEKSNRLAHAFERLGVARGDRVAVAISQHVSNPVTHLACWKLGAITVPLSILLGERAVQYRLEDSGATLVVADGTAPVTEHVRALGDRRPELTVVESNTTGSGENPTLDELSADESPNFEITDTTAETPAMLMYTSGSTGRPKGVRLTHGVWVGSCPSFYAQFEHDVGEGSVYWTPADWAWMGGLGNVVFPAWHYGRPIVGYPMAKFEPQAAFEVLEEFGITHSFIPPTALRMMMEVEEPDERYDLALDVISSGGEPLTPEIRDWYTEALSGVTVNEVYGQTEANVFVTTCHQWSEPKTGTMGKPIPGHEVGIVDAESGTEKPPGETGEIAIRRTGDPMVFDGYWKNPAETAAATVDEWHLTGDLGERDEDGYIRFLSRRDDLILTSGYRVGPREVESAILEHDGVKLASVLGVPDETRGEIIKAFVQPGNGVDASETLKEEIREFVKRTLASYEYPREIEFVESIPQTPTGKIKRQELRADSGEEH